jgi:long-chain fatty acid transport protein
MYTRAMVGGLLVCAGGELAHAGGQFVGDTGAQSMQRAGAFVAKADDPSAIFLNPAGIARLTTRQFQIGANLINLNLEFDRFGSYSDGQPYPAVRNNGSAQPIPYVGLVWPIVRFAIGAGIFAPQGYPSRNFPEQVVTANGAAQAAPQRYDSVQQSSQVIFPSLALAYRVTDKLSLGARASWGFGSFDSVTVVQGLPNPQEDPGDDSTNHLHATDSFIPAAGFGVHYAATEMLELGAVFNTPVAIRAKGSTQTTFGPNLQSLFSGTGGPGIVPVPDAQARCAPGGTPERLAACLDLNLPATASAGARLIARDLAGRERGDVELDLRWENWSNASDYRVIVDGQNALLNRRLGDTIVRHGLQDVFSARVGAAGRMDAAFAQLELRAGIGYETAAAPPSWTRLDLDGAEHYTGSAGVGVEFDHFRLDFGVAYIVSPLREVRNVAIQNTSMQYRLQPDILVPLTGDTPPYNPLNAGDYKSSYLIGSAGLTTWW